MSSPATTEGYVRIADDLRGDWMLYGSGEITTDQMDDAVALAADEIERLHEIVRRLAGTHAKGWLHLAHFPPRCTCVPCVRTRNGRSEQCRRALISEPPLDLNALAAALSKLDLIQLQHDTDGGWVECREFGPVRLNQAEHHALWLARDSGCTSEAD